MTANTSLGITLLVALVLVIALFATIAALSGRRRRNRADGSGPGDPGTYLFTGSHGSDSAGCDGGSSGGDCG